jgi:RNA polymerase primary sigma factor
MKTTIRNTAGSSKTARQALPPPPRNRLRRKGLGKATGKASVPSNKVIALTPTELSGRGEAKPGASTVIPFLGLGHRDAFELYVREIGQTALLTPAEEERLARRVQAGDLDAREHMIKANLRLVVKIAREYEGLGVPLLDLISEGNMGLMKGVERFDPDKGAKLSTYAAWWIKQNIRRAIANQSKTVRLPAHVVEKRVEIKKVETRMLELLGRLPTDAEVAEELGLEAGWVRHYRQALVAGNSLDAPLGNDEDSNVLADIVADPFAKDPYEGARENADGALVNEVLDTLNVRERDILRLRFGLTGNDEQTLEEIGVHFGLTRERIRQIQERALQKMRIRIEERESGALCA